MMEFPVIASQLGKQYSVTHEKPALIRSIFPKWFRSFRRDAFWALRGVSFEVPRGESLAVIGSNGAGKSTLLYLLAGVTPSTEGLCRLTGRVTPLLSLGAGFHPELTGEDNLSISAALLGMRSREIRQRRAEILEFAGIDGFLDVPMANYSAGMRLRLGFSVAAHAASDVLLIDEVLTVGDLAFQQKCVTRLEALRKEGMTLIFVTQDVDLARRLSDQALLLHEGRVIERGRSERVIRSYRKLAHSVVQVGSSWLDEERKRFLKRISLHNRDRLKDSWGKRFDSPEAKIHSVRFLSRRGRSVGDVASDKPLTVKAVFIIRKPLEDVHVGIAFFRDDRTYIFGPNTRFDGIFMKQVVPGKLVCRLRLESLPLTRGGYRVSAVLWDRHEKRAYAYDCAYHPLWVRGSRRFESGCCVSAVSWRAESPARFGTGSPKSARLARMARDLAPRRLKDAPLLAEGVRSRLIPATERQLRVLHWGQRVELGFHLDAEKPLARLQAWLGLIRDPDGLLCAGWPSWSQRRALTLPKGVSRLTVDAARWPLTAGRYRLVLALWNAQGRLIHWNARLGTALVTPGQPDHGLTYIPHQWKIRGAARG